VKCCVLNFSRSFICYLDCIRGKAEYLLQRGRALNVMPNYCKESEELLSKAVKLDPKLAEAWVYLGECYWKNNQIELARNCFEGSLSHVSTLLFLCRFFGLYK
jgi:tetratricopeptide (TPR) repeat protein